MKVKPYDYSYKVSSSLLSLEEHDSKSDPWYTGTFTHPLGEVDVYSEKRVTRFIVLHNKRLHFRNYDCQLSKRQLSIYAKRFLLEVLERV